MDARLLDGAVTGTGGALFAAHLNAALTVRIFNAAELASSHQAWRGLEQRALEPNPFFAADFALPALLHLTDPASVQMLAVLDRRRPVGDDLVALLPVRRRSSLFGPGLSTWTHPYIVLGTPLVDAANADAALDAMFAALALGEGPGASLVLRQIPADGPMVEALRRATGRLGLPNIISARSERAALGLEPGTAPNLAQGRRAKELRRQHRRLAEQGHVTFELADSYSGFREMLESFLALEARGWKGERGTALVQNPASATFTRSALWTMARQGQVQAANLSVDGRMVAGALVLRQGSHGMLWKIAYDETLNFCAPGVLLIDALSRALAKEGTLRLIDSCALPGNRMIESLWSDRRHLVDLVIGLSDADTAAPARTAARLNALAALRNHARSAYRLLLSTTQ